MVVLKPLYQIETELSMSLADTKRNAVQDSLMHLVTMDGSKLLSI